MATANKVELRFSEIEGRKLYATEDIRQGEEIIGLPSIGMSQPDMYSLEVYPGVHVDCSQSLVGAINHSCEANAAVKGFSIIAWSCIKAGEEITLDYKRTENKLAAPFNCFCGSKKCRGRIE